jgi:UDP:flavonoid glycosyltransferase YjiC (YdhE family)
LWQRIKPDVVVIDHSPTALLSTRALDIATVQLGTGFFVPPDADPLPSLQPPQVVPETALAGIDEEVLRAINTSLHTLGCSRLGRIAELFRGSPALLTTFPELDHYPPRADVAYVGPVSAATAYAPVDWTGEDKPRIFAYVRAATPGVDSLLAALCARRAEVKCVIPDASPALCAKLARAGIDVHTEPKDMSSALHGCNLAINYGGTGTVAQALLKGVPLLLLPQELEQGMVARRAAQLGTALIANRHTTAAFHSWIDRILGTASFASSAQQFAARYAQFDNDTASRQVASVVTSAAAGAGRSALSA